MSNYSHSNKNEELYLSIPSPDNRKRFTIINEINKQSIVLMISNELKFSPFLGLVINRFQLDSNTRKKIIVKTDCGRRIKTLEGTFNNQILYISISDLIDEDYDEDDKKSVSISPQVEEKEKYLPLFKEQKDNKNLFFKTIIKPIIKGPMENVRVIIGESYPYRCKFLISNPSIRSRVNIYFTEIPNENRELDYSFKVVFANNSRCPKLIVSELEELIRTKINISKTNIRSILFVATQYYRDNSFFYASYSGEKTTELLFPDLKHGQTISENQLLLKIYNEVEQVSKHNNIPESLAKKLLFINSFDTKSLLNNDKESNHSSLISLNPSHRTCQISLIKFNNLMKKSSQDQECSICYCDYSQNEMVELICGHKFCNNCLNFYFKESINNGNGNKMSISCPTTDCQNKCIDEVTIETMVQDSSFSKLNTKNLIRDYIFHVPGSFSCPQRGCGRLLLGITSTSKYAPYVHCYGHNFCIFCKKSGYHWPYSCVNFQHKIVDDLYSYKWILENTTVCPKCEIPVQRTMGCSHITCKCSFEFCYICSSNWREHSICQSAKRNLRVINDIKKKNVGFSDKFLDGFFASKKIKSNDPIILYLINSFFNLLSESSDKSNQSLLEESIILLRNLADMNLKHTSKFDFTVSSCQNMLKKLLRPDITLKLNFGSNYFDLIKTNNIQKVISLSANICMNGVKKSVAKLFVNTQFFDFKQEISNHLNKIIKCNNGTDIELYDPKKIRIFNQHGGQIKNSQEILDGEALFITKSANEQFIEPEIPALTPEEIEKANQDNEEDVKLSYNNTINLFKKLHQKDKRKNDKLKILENEVNQLKLQQQLKID
ncbi:hypothetical protein DICPUDRAFT_29874, partial [Dictyostelium purpureum]